METLFVVTWCCKLPLVDKIALCSDKISFREPSHHVPFIMKVGEDGYLDVDERVLCLHFNLKDGNLMLLEREEYDQDMVLMQTIYQRPHSSMDMWHYRVTPSY